MRHFIPTTILIICTFCCHAQWLDSDLYDQSLKDVLAQVEKCYGVKILYQDKNVRNKIVYRAPWKFYDQIESTLDNILRPLEMRFNKKGEGIYEIVKWDYFRKPASEGEAHLKRLLATYPNKEKWEQRKILLRENILQILGLDSIQKYDLRPIRSHYRKYDGYSVENIALEILPGVWVCGSLYMPLKYKENIPAFLSPHGHFYNKIDPSIPNERGRYRPDQQKRCAMLARMGVAVFSYDMFGWGESALAFTLTDHRSDLGLIMQTWQSIRILDYLTALPFVDKSRIGVTGASGGGTQVMIIAAIDNRISLSVPTVMMSSHFFGGCPCESGLPIHFLKNALPSNNAEFGAMMAPRPQLVISDGQDWTATTPETELPYLKQIYGYYDAANNVQNVHLSDEGHDYGYNKRVAMYDFVAEQFGLDNAILKDRSGRYDETHVTIEPATSMLVFGEKGALPAHAVKGAENLRKALKNKGIK